MREPSVFTFNADAPEMLKKWTNARNVTDQSVTTITPKTTNTTQSTSNASFTTRSTQVSNSFTSYKEGSGAFALDNHVSVSSSACDSMGETLEELSSYSSSSISTTYRSESMGSSIQVSRISGSARSSEDNEGIQALTVPMGLMRFMCFAPDPIDTLNVQKAEERAMNDDDIIYFQQDDDEDGNGEQGGESHSEDVGEIRIDTQSTTSNASPQPLVGRLGTIQVTKDDFNDLHCHSMESDHFSSVLHNSPGSPACHRRSGTGVALPRIRPPFEYIVAAGTQSYQDTSSMSRSTTSSRASGFRTGNPSHGAKDPLGGVISPKVERTIALEGEECESLATGESQTKASFIAKSEASVLESKQGTLDAIFCFADGMKVYDLDDSRPLALECSGEQAPESSLMWECTASPGKISVICNQPVDWNTETNQTNTDSGEICHPDGANTLHTLTTTTLQVSKKQFRKEQDNSESARPEDSTIHGFSTHDDSEEPLPPSNPRNPEDSYLDYWSPNDLAVPGSTSLDDTFDILHNFDFVPKRMPTLKDCQVVKPTGSSQPASISPESTWSERTEQRSDSSNSKRIKDSGRSSSGDAYNRTVPTTLENSERTMVRSHRRQQRHSGAPIVATQEKKRKGNTIYPRKIQHTIHNGRPNSNDTSFAHSTSGMESLCGKNKLSSNHRKLFESESSRGGCDSDKSGCHPWDQEPIIKRGRSRSSSPAKGACSVSMPEVEALAFEQLTLQASVEDPTISGSTLSSSWDSTDNFEDPTIVRSWPHAKQGTVPTPPSSLEILLPAPAQPAPVFPESGNNSRRTERLKLLKSTRGVKVNQPPNRSAVSAPPSQPSLDSNPTAAPHVSPTFCIGRSSSQEGKQRRQNRVRIMRLSKTMKTKKEKA